MDKDLGLQDMTIGRLFQSGDRCTYEIPIYQRNYAWEDDEIEALINDVHDALSDWKKTKDKSRARDYHIGTLVVYNRGDQRYEVIDGQQRLTTIWLILSSMKVNVQNHLTYAARRKSEDTLEAIMQGKDLNTLAQKDEGIAHGAQCVKKRLEELYPPKEDQKETEEQKEYREFWQDHVRIVRYIVPKETDLNQYFEVMNSRGEQLEMHEIVKAKLMGRLQGTDEQTERQLFEMIWEACSKMDVYVQRSFKGDLKKQIFGEDLNAFKPENYDALLELYKSQGEKGTTDSRNILDILHGEETQEKALSDTDEIKSSFQPIIDFPNFLLIVLKATGISETSFDLSNFILDDKELLREFFREENENQPTVDVRQFTYNLLKARFFLDNYMVHHSQEEDMPGSDPWQLQIWCIKDKEEAPKNLSEDQDELVKLLSMFEVSYSARQRKNYLFYCLLYLLKTLETKEGIPDLTGYKNFVSRLAESYFCNVYLNKEQLNDRNVPIPGSFDKAILPSGELDSALTCKDPISKEDAGNIFNDIYGTGETKDTASKGVPLFVFNYLDYRIWKLYAENVRGKNDTTAQSTFFHCLGCSDFGLDLLNTFYFSRTRRSLEHYFPQANVDKEDTENKEDTKDKEKVTEANINCFGNYAMISSDANSRGSNRSPQEKVSIYLDVQKKKNAKKTAGVGTASLKLLVMMQMCSDRGHWNYDDMKEHQENMVKILT